MLQILRIAVQPFAFAWGSFHTMLEASGTTSIYLGMIAFAIAVRVLAGPFLGSSLDAASDTVASRRMKNKIQKEREKRG